MTCDGHEDHIGSRVVVFIRANDYGGTLLARRLIGKRERDKNYVTEVIDGRIPHRLD